MLSTVTSVSRTLAIIVLAASLQFQNTFAQNRIQLKRDSDASIVVELANSDSIAGFQFSLHGRGGISWGTYAGSVRLNSAGLTIFQYLKDDSTLNVVLLAPFRSALPPGQGVIGRVDFGLRPGSAEVTAGAILGGVVICDAKAQTLVVTAENLTWSLRGQQDSTRASFALEQNFPNPFNPSTTISYRLTKPSVVRLTIYDLGGRLISSLVDALQNEGRHSILWNAHGNQSSKLASGMYFACLEVDGKIAIQKMILTK